MKTIIAPSSKSRLHRLLVLAALGRTDTRIRFRGLCGDISATAECLNALGADIRTEPGVLRVSPFREKDGPCALPCGESGTTLRFLLPLCGVLGREAVLYREGRLGERPLEPLLSALSARGMTFVSRGRELLCAGRLTPGAYTLPGNVSSQFISALLMALPVLEGESTLTVTGAVESAPYIAMTEEALTLAGLAWERQGNTYILPGGQTPFLPDTVTAEGDWSSAAFFLALGALSAEGITVKGLEPFSRQGDRAVLDILRAFGAETELLPDGVTVKKDVLRGMEIDCAQIPDLVPVLAVAAACAEGETVFTHASRLRLKESDRLAATADMLRALGGDVTEGPDGLLVRGGALHGGAVRSRGDHRIAMAAAVAAAVADGAVSISEKDCVNKSYPDFWKDYHSL